MSLEVAGIAGAVNATMNQIDDVGVEGVDEGVAGSNLPGVAACNRCVGNSDYHRLRTRNRQGGLYSNTRRHIHHIVAAALRILLASDGHHGTPPVPPHRSVVVPNHPLNGGSRRRFGGLRCSPFHAGSSSLEEAAHLSLPDSHHHPLQNPPAFQS